MTDAPRTPSRLVEIARRAERADGFPPLSDQVSADLADGGGITVVDDQGRGFAHLAERPDGWTLQIVVDPAARTPDRRVAADLARRARQAVAGRGRVDWWTFAATGDDTEAAAAAGFAHGRTLLQMRRRLPAEWSAAVATRRFHVGDDEAPWVAVNNRAFAGHPEQGDWTVAALERRMREDWFDPAGFRLHEIDGRIAAFCWTKIHRGEPGLPDPAGEIYVIGVDPDFQGRGLGRQLTLAGLDAISAAGVTHSLLYVDADNAAATGLYTKLGFATHRADTAYVSAG